MKKTLCVIGMLLGGMTVSPLVASDVVGKDEAVNQKIIEIALREIVQSRCARLVCVVSIDQQPIDARVLKRLKTVGKVENIKEGDFEIVHGAAKGVVRTGGRIIDVAAIDVGEDATAIVRIRIIVGPVGSSTCIYRVRQENGSWNVSQAETTCTVS